MSQTDVPPSSGSATTIIDEQQQQLDDQLPACSHHQEQQQQQQEQQQPHHPTPAAPALQTSSSTTPAEHPFLSLKLAQWARSISNLRIDLSHQRQQLADLREANASLFAIACMLLEHKEAGRSSFPQR